MSITKKKVAIFIIIFFVLAIFCYIYFAGLKWYTPWNKHKAVQIAQDYLSEKYVQEMEYSYIRIPFTDPVIYHVYFLPKGQPDCLFEVLVNTDLTLPEMPDNYLLQYFSTQLSLKWKGGIETIWEDPVNIYISVLDQPLYSFRVDKELNENMSLEEMKSYIKYDIFITVNTKLSNLNISAEAQKVFDLIQMVKKSGYFPERIVFTYQDSHNSEKNKRLIVSAWKDITQTTQILEMLKKI